MTSFGFRGEALRRSPAFATDSRKPNPNSDGWSIEMDHGAKAGEGPAALPPGTRVGRRPVRQGPAARKLLRSAARSMATASTP